MILSINPEQLVHLREQLVLQNTKTGFFRLWLLHRQFVQQFVQQSYSVNGVLMTSSRPFQFVLPNKSRVELNQTTALLNHRVSV